MAVWATLAHGRARADLRLEPRGRGRGAGVRLVPRPRGPERRDAARRPAIPLRARPRARGQEAAAPSDGGPGHRGGRHRPAGGRPAGGGAGARVGHGDPQRQAAHRAELRRGHRDRGLGLINCLTAIEAGVDRVHGTALGVGERVGNAEMDLLIVNLKLLGAHAHDISKLPEYCRLVADAVGVPIAVNYPVMGEDAFRTGTGVHAAAIIKAKKKGHAWLADRVYSSVPAQEFGLEQKIEISPVSGLSNVKYWLETHGYDPEDEAACRALFEAAKRTDRVLSDEECHRLLKQAAWR